jgi:hypothetical protein
MRKPQAEALTCWLTYKRSSSRRRLLKEMFKVVEPAACAGRCCVAGLFGGLDVSIRKAKAIPTRLRKVRCVLSVCHTAGRTRGIAARMYSPTALSRELHAPRRVEGRMASPRRAGEGTESHSQSAPRIPCGFVVSRAGRMCACGTPTVRSRARSRSNDTAIARESGQIVIEVRGELFAQPRTASA